MSAKLINNNSKTCVHPCELRDGQIAEIIKWDSHIQYIGTIVQRYREDLVSIGKKSGDSWFDIASLKTNSTLLVRVLPDGSKLEINNNQ